MGKLTALDVLDRYCSAPWPMDLDGDGGWYLDGDCVVLTRTGDMLSSGNASFFGVRQFIEWATTVSNQKPRSVREHLRQVVEEIAASELPRPVKEMASFETYADCFYIRSTPHVLVQIREILDRLAIAVIDDDWSMESAVLEEAVTDSDASPLWAIHDLRALHSSTDVERSVLEAGFRRDRDRMTTFRYAMLVHTSPSVHLNIAEALSDTREEQHEPSAGDGESQVQR